MSNCCPKQGLLKDIDPIIEGLRGENDRMAATFAIMALIRFFNDHHSNFLVGVKIIGNTITFTRNDGTTIDIELPIPSDEYVNGAYINNKKLILQRNVGNDIQVDLSNIIPEIPELDTSMFFASCELNGNTILFKNQNGVILDRVNIIDTYVVDGGLLQDSTDNSFYIQLDYNRQGIPSLQIPLNDLYSSIINKIPFIPGYYKSKQKQTTPQFNTTTIDTQYLGTTWDPKTQYPTYDYQYIYKVISEREYVLVAQYKVPRDGYYYVVSSGVSSVKYNTQISQDVIDEKSKRLPGGVIGIIKWNGSNLEIERLDKYFLYITADTNTVQSSITYQQLINNNPVFTIEGKDNLGGTATAEHCMFYPSRFIKNENFIGRYDWNPNNINNFGELVEEFNTLIIQSGYRYLYEIKYEDLVDTVDIINNQSDTSINGDIKEGLRNTEIRPRLLERYIGKARLIGSNYVTSGVWPDINNYITSGNFQLDNYTNWENKESLEFIWSYIMTNYFNSTNPDGAISTVCYSDNTGWYTTYSHLSIFNTSYGFIINANTECSGGEVVDPGNDYLPNISDTNLPCSNFLMVFDLHTNDMSAHGSIRLNIGGRQWEYGSETPYRYFQFSKVNSENVIINLESLLYKTTLKSCNFIIERINNEELISENIKYSNGDTDVTVTKLNYQPITQ